MTDIIFPDVEPLIIAHLKSRLESFGETDVRVATKKAKPEADQPAKQVIVTAQYSRDLDIVRKAVTCTIDVWADQYQTASELALLVGAVIVSIPFDPIKKCVVTLGPLRIAEPSEEEHRALTAEMIVKGAHL